MRYEIRGCWEYGSGETAEIESLPLGVLDSHPEFYSVYECRGDSGQRHLEDFDTVAEAVAHVVKLNK